LKQATRGVDVPEEARSDRGVEVLPVLLRGMLDEIAIDIV
jgi:hypothetical protein